MSDISKAIKKRILYTMLKIRRFEEKIVGLYSLQEIQMPVHLCIGQEAVAAGVCASLGKNDTIFSTHRNHGHYIAKGGDVKSLMAELYGKITGCAKGKGGSMHTVAINCGIRGTSAIVGGGIALAAGTALASQINNKKRVSVSFFGDGAVDEGIFHEIMNFASLKKLPLIFICENNFYATNSHILTRQPHDNIAARADSYGIKGIQIDGNNVMDVYNASSEAIKRARFGLGPTLIECRTHRWMAHVGVEYDYKNCSRPMAELETRMQGCPIAAFKNYLLRNNIITEAHFRNMINDIDAEIECALRFAKKSAFPAKAGIYKDVYYKKKNIYINKLKCDGGDVLGWRKITYGEAIREAHAQTLKDKKVLILGEGVNDESGVYGSTFGLAKKFGNDRIIDIPIAENGLTGVAVGLAIAGMRPVFVHMRMDFLFMCMDQIINHATKWYYMTGGQVKIPFVIRCIIGRGWGVGAQHSQAIHSMFLSVPGIKIVIPATPYDAKGLLASAINDGNPILYVEHRLVYERAGYVPESLYMVPIGKGAIRRIGEDVTIIAVSHMVYEALDAAAILGMEGIDAEVIDLRTLKPLDENLIIKSVKKTRRLVIADVAVNAGGIGSEIAALIAERLGYLKISIVRVGLPDVPTPASPRLEKAYYPGKDCLISAVKRLMRG